jgi:hypothetical protein
MSDVNDCGCPEVPDRRPPLADKIDAEHKRQYLLSSSVNGGLVVPGSS